MQENYKLSGILNLFNVIPDFIYPVFEKDNQYYFLTGDEETLRTEGFEPVIQSCVGRIIPLSNLKTNEFQQTEFSKESEPIFGFQLSETDVFFGFFEDIEEFLKSYETEDEILKSQIDYFLNNTGTK